MRRGRVPTQTKQRIQTNLEVDLIFMPIRGIHKQINCQPDFNDNLIIE